LLRASDRERRGEGGRGLATLAGVRLIDDDREATPALLIPNIGEDVRKLLHRGDDDLLAALDEPAQVAGVLGVAHRRAHLGELLDRVADLLIEAPPGGAADDRIEARRGVLAQAAQLVSQRGD